MITKIHFNKWGVKFRLEDQRRKLEVLNTTYMIIAENYNIMAKNWKIIEEPCTCLISTEYDLDLYSTWLSYQLSYSQLSLLLIVQQIVNLDRYGIAGSICGLIYYNLQQNGYLSKWWMMIMMVVSELWW